MEFISDFSTSDGRYYTRRLTFNTIERFPFIILKASQIFGYTPVGATYTGTKQSDGNIVFSSNDITYDLSTRTITIDNRDSAWTYPIIIFPSGYIS